MTRYYYGIPSSPPCSVQPTPSACPCKKFMCLSAVTFVWTEWMHYCRRYTGLFIRPSGISELDCATTKTDTAERSISIDRESLQFFFVLGALVYLQVPPLGGSRHEKWRSQWIRKRSVSWNLPKLSQLWRCNAGFGSCTTQNHLDTAIREWYKKFQQSGCLCAAKRSGRLGPSAETVERVREAFVRSPQKSTTRTSEQL